MSVWPCSGEFKLASIQNGIGSGETEKESPDLLNRHRGIYIISLEKCSKSILIQSKQGIHTGISNVQCITKGDSI